MVASRPRNDRRPIAGGSLWATTRVHNTSSLMPPPWRRPRSGPLSVMHVRTSLLCVLDPRNDLAHLVGASLKVGEGPASSEGVEGTTGAAGSGSSLRARSSARCFIKCRNRSSPRSRLSMFRTRKAALLTAKALQLAMITLHLAVLRFSSMWAACAWRARKLLTRRLARWQRKAH